MTKTTWSTGKGFQETTVWFQLCYYCCTTLELRTSVCCQSQPVCFPAAPCYHWCSLCGGWCSGWCCSGWHQWSYFHSSRCARGVGGSRCWEESHPEGCCRSGWASTGRLGCRWQGRWCRQGPGSWGPERPPATGVSCCIQNSFPAAVAGGLVPWVQNAGVAGDLCLECKKSTLIAALHRRWLPWWRLTAAGGGGIWFWQAAWLLMDLCQCREQFPNCLIAYTFMWLEFHWSYIKRYTPCQKAIICKVIG